MLIKLVNSELSVLMSNVKFQIVFTLIEVVVLHDNSYATAVTDGIMSGSKPFGQLGEVPITYYSKWCSDFLYEADQDDEGELSLKYHLIHHT